MAPAELPLLENCLFIGAMLFGIGLVGFLARRNMIVMFLAAEMMLQGVSVSLVAWGRYYNDWGGQVLVIFIIAIAACEAAVALALVLMLFQRTGRLDVAAWHELREANQPVTIDEELSEEPLPMEEIPHLPPAGIAPEVHPEQTEYREHV
jgi:NADH-quinone oxidoreductase subunit K